MDRLFEHAQPRVDAGQTMRRCAGKLVELHAHQAHFALNRL
jgi:hypothetical protein